MAPPAGCDAMLQPRTAFGKAKVQILELSPRCPVVAIGKVLRSGPMTILKWALIFFLVSIVAGILGFTGISAASADVARFLFYVFVVIFLVLLILGLTIFRT
jgi:uncharacterized membrane protein YtjA (UPF0391 family)